MHCFVDSQLGRRVEPDKRSGHKVKPMIPTAPKHASPTLATQDKSQDPTLDVDSVPGPGLVPELLVTSLEKSVDFWCRLCGFEVLYDRPNEGFAYIVSDTAHIMLEQEGMGRNWIPAVLEPPLGRGINFQITVASIDPLIASLRAAGWSLFMEPETKWYRTGKTQAGVAQFLVQDPDGYLIRFQSSLGRRSFNRDE